MWTLLAIFFLQFADKSGSNVVCLSPMAQQMRMERGIEIDSLDYAVSPIYLDSVGRLGAKVLHTSRWMNGATVEASDEVMHVIEKCGFVDTIYLTRTDAGSFGKGSVSLRKREVIEYPKNQQIFRGSRWQEGKEAKGGQLAQLNLLPLHQAGYKGQGIRIGIADGGFYNADSLESLPKDQWLGYADFTDEEKDIFSPTSNHGSLCLSAIMAQSVDYEGAAREAEYYLFRTEESSTESPKEIDNWVAAIEMADSLGLHIVSTSLGYRTFDDEQFDFAYADMDGKSSRGAQAATIAVSKGMLLVVAMGNDGNKTWHYLSTPSDADNILSVGAVDVAGKISEFSSYGPSADGRVKPEVCAMGSGTLLIDPSTNEVTNGNGTSFACPLIAGMAACVWSALPDATNMEIRERIIRSADRYSQPHEQYGYGIPNAWQAYRMQWSTNLQPIIRVSTAQKIFINGQIYIQKKGIIYDLLGNKIE